MTGTCYKTFFLRFIHQKLLLVAIDKPGNYLEYSQIFLEIFEFVLTPRYIHRRGTHSIPHRGVKLPGVFITMKSYLLTVPFLYPVSLPISLSLSLPLYPPLSSPYSSLCPFLYPSLCSSLYSSLFPPFYPSFSLPPSLTPSLSLHTSLYSSLYLSLNPFLHPSLYIPYVDQVLEAMGFGRIFRRWWPLHKEVPRPPSPYTGSQGP